jgi:hypothetical protein
MRVDWAGCPTSASIEASSMFPLAYDPVALLVGLLKKKGKNPGLWSCLG